MATVADRREKRRSSGLGMAFLIVLAMIALVAANFAFNKQATSSDVHISAPASSP